MTIHILSRRPALVATLWLTTAMAGGGLFLARFQLNNSVGIWFPENDPALAGYEQFLDTFGPWEWTLVLLEPRLPEEAALLAEVDALETRLEALPGVRQALGPAVLAALAADSPPMAAGPPVLPQRMPMLLETANEIHRGDDFRAELLEAIGREVDACPGIASHTVVGTSVINVGLNRSAKRDMLLFFNLVFVLLLAVGWLLLRSWRDLAVLLGVASSAVLLTLGLAAASGHRFNILTIMMPTVLIALSVANLVHLIYEFHDRRAAGLGSRAAAERAVREVRLPTLGTAATTVIGFLSLAGSDMPPVRQLALFSAAGITLAWLATLTVAPGLLAYAWRGRTDTPARVIASFSLLGAWGRRLPRAGWLLGVAMLVFLPVLLGFGRLETNTNYVEFFRPGSDVRKAYDEVARAGLAQSNLEVVLRSERGLDARTLSPFLQAVGALSPVRGILAPGGPIPLDGFTAEDGRTVRAVLFSDFLGNDSVGDLAGRIRSLGAELLPGHTTIQVTGSPVLWERMDASIVRTQKSSILLVALGTLALLAVIFRDPWVAAVGWLGSILPVGLILGLMGWLGVPVTLASVLIAGIALGLAVDDTVHFVVAFRRRVAAGEAALAAVQATLLSVGERMIATSFILAGAFSVMGFSDFVPTATFGIFTALTILLALAADLFLIPWILGTTGKAMPVRLSRTISAGAPSSSGRRPTAAPPIPGRARRR